jgi:hypothetical protein
MTMMRMKREGTKEERETKKVNMTCFFFILIVLTLRNLEADTCAYTLNILLHSALFHPILLNFIPSFTSSNSFHPIPPSLDDEEQPPSGPGGAGSGGVKILDLTDQDLVNLRRTLYLTIMSSVSFEECAHKITKLKIPDGYELELCNMLGERVFSI